MTSIEKKMSRRNNKKKLSKISINHGREKHFNKIITNINSLVSEIKDNQYIKYTDYITKILAGINNDLKRKNFKDRSRYSIYKNNPLFYFSNMFFENNSENRKLKIKNNLYKNIIKVFDLEGVSILEKILIEFENVLKEKKYDPVDLNTIYDPVEFNKALLILDIDCSKKVGFTEIKKKYNIKKEYAGGNTEIKNLINKAFILLRDQYEEYLLSDIDTSFKPTLSENEFIFQKKVDKNIDDNYIRDNLENNEV